MRDGELKPPAAMHRVIVRFREHVELPYERGAEESLAKYGRSAEWIALRSRLPEITLVPVFALSDGQLDRLTRRAQLGRENARGLKHGRPRFEREPPLANPRRFFQVRVSNPELAIAMLSAWSDIVAAAYFDPPGENPAPPFSNKEVDAGGHLDPAPRGVDVAAVWGADGLGHDVRVVDIERGADLGHPDLPAGVGLIPGAAPGSGAAADEDHGLQVFGILVAQENERDALGIVTRLDELLLSPYTNDDSGHNLETAIGLAAAYLRCGDVILLEVHKDGRPAEAFEGVAEAVRLATAAGIVVVAAAGNGTVDLDADPSPYVSTTHPAKIDTGSILVGAGHPSDRVQPDGSSHRTWIRRPKSNYGVRVNCFAPGVSVRTTAGQPGAYGHYLFAETSAAAAIVAGVAAAVQGIARAKHNGNGRPYHPLELRDLLGTGATPSKNGAADKIGAMPNLKACAAALFEPDFECPSINGHSDDDAEARAGSQLDGYGSAPEGGEPANHSETTRGHGSLEEAHRMPPIVEFSQVTKNTLLSAITNMVGNPPRFPANGATNQTAHDVHKVWIDELLSSDRVRAQAALTQVGIVGVQADKVLHALDIVADLGPAIYDKVENEIANLHGPGGHNY